MKSELPFAGDYGCEFPQWMTPEQVAQFVTLSRDAEIIWCGFYRAEMCVAIEPQEPGDEAIARRLGLRLLCHLDHPEVPWVRIYENLNEQT